MSAKDRQDEKVLEYIRNHPRQDDAEIAKALRLDEINVLDSLVRLKKKGLVVPTED